jgi:hypothetical protein
VPLAGERVAVLDPGLLGQAADERADPLELADRGQAHRALGLGDLDHDVDEGAALEVLLAEPVRERVEDCEQALGRGAAAALGLRLQPGARPELLAPLEEGEDQVVLRGEVAVERHLRDAALGDDPVDPDRPGAVPAEQLVGGVQDPLARGLPSADARFGNDVHPRGWYRAVPRDRGGAPSESNAARPTLER